MEGVHVVGGRATGTEVPRWVQGQSPGRGLGDKVPKTETKCEIIVQFVTFSCIKILDLMNTRAGLWEYILQTHNTNFFGKFNGGLNPLAPSPSGYASDLYTFLFPLSVVIRRDGRDDRSNMFSGHSQAMKQMYER